MDIDLLVFDPAQGFVPTSHKVSGRVIIDSFPVELGRTSHLDLHLERFSQACGICVPRKILEAALSDIMWGFPRLEYEVKTGQIFLRLRSMRPIRTETSLFSVTDTRERPEIKGWDLGLIDSLRAGGYGCDDILFLNPDGLVKEAGYAVVAWWEGEQLCSPRSELGIVNSTTLKRTATHIPIIRKDITVATLAKHVAMVGSALHGWTALSSIVNDEAQTLILPQNVNLLERANRAWGA
ncbi:aminotransferase class IV [Corynebacterium sp. ES2794-CONJ1]|uniref:aminotransferase class IV n=1 Tax=unclassified Corynebacterium TaxID=2624378 RepID=UPI0021685068|nr:MULTISPECIES: aminotransferase class IV [unclassified Corynebacterium]MCS4489933.1 aminotransferase class IV [Corynebacterium sp. ES2775-CONJ]MCU9519205.1 aminotransferase class IV [Corynebacterium sp. ES2794-CONJ1]